MSSELSLKKLELQALQLEHNSLAVRYKLKVAENQEERKRKLSDKISKLISKKLCLDPHTDSLYKGPRSRNCKNCVLGHSQAVNLTEYCNKSCFFCPQRRTKKTCFDRPLNYYTSSKENDKQIIEGMRSNNSTGCGLTGGEPLVVYEKSLHYIRLLKKHLGKKFWIHLYTNGDLLDQPTLLELKEVGLDEIRFNLAAVGYNLEKVFLAREYIPKVLIEIPVIPEDRDELYRLMFELEKLGIDGINLHEMVVNSYNAEKMCHKGYMVAQAAYETPFYLMNNAPISGSKELILDLLDLALTEQFSYGVHYCHYKARILKQNFSRFFQVALKCRRPYEQINEEGLLEKLVISEPGIADALADLEKHQVPKEKIHLSKSKRRLETSIDYLKFLNPQCYEAAVVKTLPQGFFQDVSIEILK